MQYDNFISVINILPKQNQVFTKREFYPKLLDSSSTFPGRFKYKMTFCLRKNERKPHYRNGKFVWISDAKIWMLSTSNLYTGGIRNLRNGNVKNCVCPYHSVMPYFFELNKLWCGLNAFVVVVVVVVLSVMYLNFI